MPIELSIIIVNYNVKAFLEQCLYAVIKAGKNIDTEIFVVDNNSVDGSIEMLKQSFPSVKLIFNSKNKGFAFACNQAIKKSTGKYILLLNPDTVIKEDSLTLCWQFMEKMQDAGAMGVRMINGKGQFLPESKRSLPTAKSAFFKMFGLAALFPKSKFFGKYQLKYLDENKIHEIEVLSGAFMFIRKSVLEKIGLLDEKFFMYGEDIDLSYRILQANFKNYYFPKTTIIHYKGESTKKASFKYVKVFYNAMLIFANKHYKGHRQYFFRRLIQLAIYLRAAIEFIKRIFASIYLPILDFSLVYLSYVIVVPIWEYYKFSNHKVYSEDFLTLYVPAYIIIWQSFIYYFTTYHFKTKVSKVIKAISLGTVGILAIYSLLPESYRYSRVLILFGAISTLVISISTRLIIRLISNKGKGFSISWQKKALLVGSNQNTTFTDYPETLNQQYEICSTFMFDENNRNQTIRINQLKEIIQIHKIETLIFFSKNLSTSNIINSILKINDKYLEFKIILPESTSMLGPKSVIDLQKLPHFKMNLISSPLNHFKKRMIDVVIVFIFVLSTPIFLLKNKARIFFKINWQVLKGKFTWVSYFKKKGYHIQYLPVLPPGVFPVSATPERTDQEILEINLNYAKNYQQIKDIIIIFKALKSSFILQYPFDNEIVEE